MTAMSTPACSKCMAVVWRITWEKRVCLRGWDTHSLLPVRRPGGCSSLRHETTGRLWHSETRPIPAMHHTNLAMFLGFARSSARPAPCVPYVLCRGVPGTTWRRLGYAGVEVRRPRKRARRCCTSSVEGRSHAGRSTASDPAPPGRHRSPDVSDSQPGDGRPALPGWPKRERPDRRWRDRAVRPPGRKPESPPDADCGSGCRYPDPFPGSRETPGWPEHPDHTRRESTVPCPWCDAGTPATAETCRGSHRPFVDWRVDARSGAL